MTSLLIGSIHPCRIEWRLSITGHGSGVTGGQSAHLCSGPAAQDGAVPAAVLVAEDPQTVRPVQLQDKVLVPLRHQTAHRLRLGLAEEVAVRVDLEADEQLCGWGAREFVSAGSWGDIVCPVFTKMLPRHILRVANMTCWTP